MNSIEFQWELCSFPMRAEPSHKAQMVSEILFGERFVLVEKKESWQRIELLHDGYQGWIEWKQAFRIARERATHIVCETVKFKDVYLYPGSLLTAEIIAQNPELRLRFLKPIGLIGDVNQLFGILQHFITCPYYWGGRSLRGIDCSGLVQVSFACMGISLPRDAYQQATLGQEIPFEKITLGDLAFFENEQGKIVHVGICLGENQIIHASQFVRIDFLKKDGIYCNIDHQKSHQLSFIRRIKN